jgi:hypothetical protein
MSTRRIVGWLHWGQMSISIRHAPFSSSSLHCTILTAQADITSWMMAVL